jgi:hypothetical protein
MKYSHCMAHSENEILVAGSDYSEFNNVVIKFYPKNGTWSELYKSPDSSRIRGLFQLGQKIFVKQSNSISQFDPSTNKFNDTGLRTNIGGHSHISSMAVPAKVFSNLPRGCEGVE